MRIWDEVSTSRPKDDGAKGPDCDPRVRPAEAERSVIGRIRNDFEAAQRRENLLAANYADAAKIVSAQADKVTHYNTLKREVDTDRQLYDSILQRVKEAGVASALDASNIQCGRPRRCSGQAI